LFSLISSTNDSESEVYTVQQFMSHFPSLPCSFFWPPCEPA